ncbi:MAG: hypothetical protein FJY56_06930 [Betaproteobacteria bacterium]|nr:hypothetical protein [Betaproteobacteria bacterium]
MVLHPPRSRSCARLSRALSPAAPRRPSRMCRLRRGTSWHPRRKRKSPRRKISPRPRAFPPSCRRRSRGSSRKPTAWWSTKCR